MKTARENGIDAFAADVLVDNHGMMRVFHKVAGKIEAKLQSGVYSLRFSWSKCTTKKSQSLPRPE